MTASSVTGTPGEHESGQAMGAPRDQPIGGLRQSAVKGAFFTSLAQVAKLIVQFGSVIVLSRLLSPADFGLFAMVAPLYGLALIFQDFGLGHATVQSAQVTPAQSSALFWLNIAVSLCLAVPLIFGAPLVGWFYHDERLVALTRSFAVVIVVGALGAQHSALLNRSIRFRYLAALDATAALAGFLGAVLLAVIFHTYWALFAAAAIGSTVTATGAWLGTRFVPRLPRGESGVWPMVRLGAGITGYNVSTFIARNLDNVLIGRVWGDAPLGFYDRAYKLLLFPLLQINAPLARVMLPMLACLRTDGPRYRSAYLQAVNQLLLVTQPGIVFAIATADIFVPILLGNDWRAAAPIFQWLGVAALLQPFSVATNWLFISQGRSRAYALWGAFNAIICAVAFCVGLPWGPIGVAAAYSISQVLLRSPVVLWIATRTGPVRLRDLCSIGTMHALAGAVSFIAIVVARRAVPLEGVPALAVLLCLSYAITLLVLAFIPSGRTALRDSMSIVTLIASRA
jgi:PST family polysaccharide transporter